MTLSVSIGGLSLTDFTAYELPTTRWLKLIRPKMRLRVRVLNVLNRDYVSSTVKVDDHHSQDASNVSSIHWPWNDDEQFPRPSLADDEEFEIKIERRFLLWYKCIRRTQPMSIDQIRTGDYCALPLYDERPVTGMFEDRIKIGDITFTLRDDASSDEARSGKATSSAYSLQGRPA